VVEEEKVPEFSKLAWDEEGAGEETPLLLLLTP